MKTWVFSRDTLNKEIECWVKHQIESGHPKAVANAKFVGDAIMDFLEKAPTLHRTYTPQGTSQNTHATVSIKESPFNEETSAVVTTEQLDHLDIRGMSPSDMLKVWEQTK